MVRQASVSTFLHSSLVVSLVIMMMITVRMTTAIADDDDEDGAMTTTTFGVLAQVLLATVMQEVLGAVVQTIFSSGKHSCTTERP